MRLDALTSSLFKDVEDLGWLQEGRPIAAWLFLLVLLTPCRRFDSLESVCSFSLLTKDIA